MIQTFIYFILYDNGINISWFSIVSRAIFIQRTEIIRFGEAFEMSWIVPMIKDRKIDKLNNELSDGFDQQTDLLVSWL